jgi:ABC-type Mn2+/Zn2+ transport system ATPase subunit
MAASKNDLRIKSINVTGLFGLYSHHVALKDDHVTVIHGPNGVGKTVFLKLTNALLRGRYSEIARVPFSSFEIVFDDNSVARIKMDEVNNSKRMDLSVQAHDGQLDSVVLDDDFLNTSRQAQQIAESHPYFSQIGIDEWIDRRTDERISADDLVERAGNLIPKNAQSLALREPQRLRELRGRINVHLIEVQRLIRQPKALLEWRPRSISERPITITVEEYSRDLKAQLETTLATYAKQSQELDQSFPQRLLAPEVPRLTTEQLKVEMDKVEGARDNLIRIGILDGDSTPDAYSQHVLTLDEQHLLVMSVYAVDTLKKLSVFENLSKRVEVFLDILNRKFTNKKVTLSRELGLAIIGSDGNSIPITALSSGEQHELVLLYDLLFKVEPKTLVLIDEPELSLHISWQKGFMEDLLEIIKLAQFDVLIATHSPYIVGDRSDLLVVLSSDVAAPKAEA